MLTELFVRVRYARHTDGAEAMGTARRAAALALRGWTRGALSRRLFGWMRRP